MHCVSHLVIRNFRACADVSLPLTGYTPLVGQNNTGKSTILRAIEWVLKPKALSLEDFFDPTKSVEVAACIDGISEDILECIPEHNHRTAITPYCSEGRLWIRVAASGVGAKSISRQIWDPEQYSGSDIPEHWRDYPTGLPQAVSALLPEPLVINAMHDLGEDLGKAKAGTTIKELLDEIMGPLLAAHAELTKSLETIRHVLTADGDKRSEYLQKFDTDASDALSNFFPDLALDLDLQIVDVREFFKAGDLHVTDKMTGDRRRFDQVGTGAQRAIQMALIRYLAGSRSENSNRPARRMLLIDEPELYLHPQGVRRLRQALARLAETGFQIVFSTHSPMMLSRESAADTIIVAKTTKDGTTTQKPLRQAVDEAISNAESQSRTLFELGNLAEIYFADLVILCEGKTDRRILPLAYEVLYRKPPDLDQVAFVSLGSCSDIPRALRVLSAMAIPACAVADLDFAYTHARSGGLLDKEGEDLNLVKNELRRLQGEHDFPLSDNGLPRNDKHARWRASETWAVMADDPRGSVLFEQVQKDLLPHRVWVWREGCIEDVTGCGEKGEGAIIEQERRMTAMSAADIEKEMPGLKACFDWIKSI